MRYDQRILGKILNIFFKEEVNPRSKIVSREVRGWYTIRIVYLSFRGKETQFPHDRDINIPGRLLMAQVQGLAVHKSPADMFIDCKQKDNVH